MRFPTLDEPSWLEDDSDEEMEAPADSPFRGMWIGITAAAVTFVLVFAIPQWLGWYDIATPPKAKREVTAESVIATVTAQPSGAAVVETAPPAGPAAAAPPATAPRVTPPKAAAPRESKPAAPRESNAAAPRESKPAAPAATAAARSDDATFWVQVAAFKNAGQAGRLAAKVKRDGYPAEVRRLREAPVPWVVWVGTYPSRERAESARAALARKGLRGFIR
ncbi:MAG: SPOR domain-containing protein [Candidatus Rokuibacteriota bacterium]